MVASCAPTKKDGAGGQVRCWLTDTSATLVSWRGLAFGGAPLSSCHARRPVGEAIRALTDGKVFSLCRCLCPSLSLSFSKFVRLSPSWVCACFSVFLSFSRSLLVSFLHTQPLAHPRPPFAHRQPPCAALIDSALTSVAFTAYCAQGPQRWRRSAEANLADEPFGQGGAGSHESARASGG